jgi:hypothetical protein
VSERRRNALLVALLVAFAALALAINGLLADGSVDPASPTRAVERDELPATGGEPAEPEVREQYAEGRQPPQRGAVQARRPSRETAPPERRIERRDREVLAEAAPVARRFLRAFALYEVGHLDGRIHAGLRTSATAEFFSELVSRPPRLPPGADLEPVGVAGDFELVPVAADPAGRELVEVELVGALRRVGERTPIGLRMLREEGRWRVAGLTR